MRRVLAAALSLAAAALVQAQVTTTASWTFGAADQTDATAPWSTSEGVEASITARWGSDLSLAAGVQSNFDAAALTGDRALSRLEITWNLNEASILTVGRQALSWGTARVFSSIDSLKPPLDPLNLKAKGRGVTGVKLEILPADWLSASVLALPAPRLDDATLATRFDVLWEDADLSLGAVRVVTRPLTGVDAGLHAIRPRREEPTVFADFSRFFDRFGVYAEAQARWGRGRDWFIAPSPDGGSVFVADLDAVQSWTARATAGLQAEFPAWLNGTIRLLCEYHYNGDGFTTSEAKDFRDAWKLSTQQTLTAFEAPGGLSVGSYRQHYAYLGVSGIPLAEKLSLGASVLAGLDAGLWISSGNVSWDVGQSINVGLGYDHFHDWQNQPELSELLFLPSRNRINLTVTAWY